MKYLATPEGRRAEIQKIENSFLQALRINGIEIASNAVCRVYEGRIDLGIEHEEKLAFASEVTLYDSNRHYTFGATENEINYGSSGSFTPTNQASFWRTVHAANILKNWEIACDIVNTHCTMMTVLRNEIINI